MAGIEQQAANEILKELLRFNKTWPYTLGPQSSSGFNEANATFWKEIFQVGGDQVLEKLKPVLASIQTNDLESQCMVAELIGNFSNFYPFIHSFISGSYSRK